MMHRARGKMVTPLRRRAFTLVELLVAIAILAAVAAAIVPSLSRAVDRARFNAAAREVAAALRTARYEAVARQQEAVFTLDTKARRYRVFEIDRALALPADATLSLLTARTEQLDEAAGAIRFFTDGSSSGGSIALSYGDTESTIAVAWLTGRVTITR